MTAQKVFEIAMTLIDETPTSGVFDVERTADYKAKAPYLLTMLQDEVCRYANLFKELDVTASGTEGYVKLTLPADFISLYQLLDSNMEFFHNFKRVGNDIYVPFDFSGKIIYKYQPVAIVSLTDTVSVDDYIANTILSNGLGAQLITTENPDLSNFLQQRFEEAKRSLMKKQLSSYTTIKDVYDSKLSY